MSKNGASARIMWKKVLKWAGLVLLGVVLLVTLFYAVENVRGKLAWARHARECAELGESLDWRAFIPAPVPDDENAAMAPIFREMLSGSERLRLPYPHYPSDTNTIVGAGIVQTGRYRGLAPWRAALSNDNLLAALAVYDDDLREAGEALKRPFFRTEEMYEVSFTDLYPLGYRGMEFVPYSLIRICNLQAQARYEAGQYDKMLENIQALLHIAGFDKDLILPSIQNKRMRTFLTANALVWLGINGRAWDAQQLATLQHSLQEINFIECFRQEFRLYLSAVVSRLVSPHVDVDPEGFRFPEPLEEIPPWLLPRGWRYQLAVYVSRFARQQEQLIHLNDHWFDFAQVDTIFGAVPCPYFMEALPMGTGSISVFAEAQAQAHQAVIACAVERYRLAHGQIPRQLDALVPQYLAKIPCDPCDGQPMRYKPVGDSDYILYSIARNGVDDGGQLGIEKTDRGIIHVDRHSGDWIWRSGSHE